MKHIFIIIINEFAANKYDPHFYMYNCVKMCKLISHTEFT